MCECVFSVAFVSTHLVLRVWIRI